MDDGAHAESRVSVRSACVLAVDRAPASVAVGPVVVAGGHLDRAQQAPAPCPAAGRPQPTLHPRDRRVVRSKKLEGLTPGKEKVGVSKCDFLEIQW
jgi:hypothetical protein